MRTNALLLPTYPEVLSAPPDSKVGDPAWSVALFFPSQGQWTEDDYLALESRANILVELSDGCIEVLPTPTMLHQLLVQFLFERLNKVVKRWKLGKVFFAPLPVRLGSGKYREPDIVFLRPARIKDLKTQPHGAELVMEVLSPGEKNRLRDLRTKKKEYAQAGIPEYWIVDPEEGQVTVLVLEDGAYREHGVFGTGERATSATLPRFAIKVDQLFSVK